MLDLKKIDHFYFENKELYSLLRDLLPNCIVHEIDKPQCEILGIFQTFLLPKTQILYRVKIITKSRKSLFDKNIPQKKYELKVIMGVKRNSETPEIFNRNHEFCKYCLKILFFNIFAPFYGESKRLFENKLETLEEEADDAMMEESPGKKI